LQGPESSWNLLGLTKYAYKNSFLGKDFKTFLNSMFRGRILVLIFIYLTTVNPCDKALANESNNLMVAPLKKNRSCFVVFLFKTLISSIDSGAGTVAVLFSKTRFLAVKITEPALMIKL
jgi:hypothetical protein